MLVKLDGKKMVDIQSTHEYLKNKLGLPENYGKNLDALWDLLSERNDSLKILLYNDDYMYGNLNGYGESILSLLEDITLENENIKFEVIVENNIE